MNNNVISGSLVYKGEPGLSAYELAVQNGYEGTLDEWLRSLGTSSMFNQYSTSYTTTESTTDFELPEEYVDGGFVDVYVDGLHIKSSEYTVVNENNSYLVRFDTAISSGKSVELLTTMISTQNLPISVSISDGSTNDTASGSKAVYDYIESKKSILITNEATNDEFPTSKAVYDYLQTFFDAIYPVGSIYMSVNSSNPALLFGGTWEQIKDRFLLASSTTYPIGTGGGESSHILTADEMPSHKHGNRIDANDKPHWNNRKKYTTDTSLLSDVAYQYRTAGNNYLVENSATTIVGGGQAHNNMPPYLAVNIWKRVA